MNVIGVELAVCGLCLGVVFEGAGQNTQADKRQFEAIKAQAQNGDAQAQFALGTFYSFGTGVSRDLAKALKWHRKAAEQGLAQAQLRVAYEYDNGLGVKADPIEAAKWVRRAAEQGLAEAQFELGRCYAEARGVGENPEEAAQWYRKAADQNFAPAEYELGNCYFNGYGVTKDISNAVTWTGKAAEQGYGPAENSYGMYYAKGRGVAQDYVQAYKWLNLAAAQANQDNTEAKINLSMAERAMTPEQITEAQKLARDFKSATRPIEKISGSNQPENSIAEGGRSGTINIKADDESCEIYADGAFVGNAPAKLKLEPGMHVIVVKKAGFKEYRRELKLTQGAELSLRAALERE